MTAIIRGLAVSVVLAGCAIGLASPASAELTDGTYQLTYSADPGPAPKTIVVTSCGDGCKLSQIVGPYNAVEYHLQGDTWTAPSADGSVMTIDNNTLAGTANTWAIQLTKIS
jgi:major membrane immunogen (membrane-anchored lipoprotein)